MPDTAIMSSQYEDLARASLLDITKPESIGPVVSESPDADGVITVRFASDQPGYPGWEWNVSLAHVDGYDPTVIEAELLPAEGALLAPDWVPWSDRLAEYKAAQEAAGLEADAAEGEGGEGDADDVDDDDLDDDELDDDELDDDDDEDAAPKPVLHGGDLDGVDIDEHDFSADDVTDDDAVDDGDAEDDAADTDAADEIGDEVAEYGASDTEDD